MRVLVADDHALVRQAIVSFLNDLPEVTVVGEAAMGDEAVDQAEQLQPDVIVMDVSMPQMGGVKAARMIRDILPEVRLVFLTMYGPESVEPLLKSWPAVSYVAKSDGLDSLLTAVVGEKDQV